MPGSTKDQSPVLGLPSHTVWELARMPPSTLNYWVQIGLVTPSLRRPQGRRVEYWWSVEDVVIVRSLRALRQVGAPLQKLREARRVLAAWGESLASAHVVWDGHDLLMGTDDGPLTSLIASPGQQLFTVAVLPLAQWHAETASRAELVDLAEFRQQRRRRLQAQRSRRQPFRRLGGS